MDYSNLSDYELYTGLVRSVCKSIDMHLDTLSRLYMLRDITIEKRGTKNEFLENRIKFYEGELKKVYENKEFCEKETKKYVSDI